MFTEIKLPNPGVLITTLPSELFDELKIDIDDLISKKTYIKKIQKHNTNLAGHLENSYNYLPKENFKNFLKDFCDQYCIHFNVPKIKIKDFASTWINVQKKYEFNPLHVHTGILSWVIWIKIPYDLQNEDRARNSKNSNANENSRFYFTYSQFTGKIARHTLNIDKSFEGKIILFPSNLYHAVNPFFTSDEHRISMAGNVFEIS